MFGYPVPLIYHLSNHGIHATCNESYTAAMQHKCTFSSIRSQILESLGLTKYQNDAGFANNHHMYQAYSSINIVLKPVILIQLYQSNFTIHQSSPIFCKVLSLSSYYLRSSSLQTCHMYSIFPFIPLRLHHCLYHVPYVLDVFTITCADHPNKINNCQR